MILYHGTTKKFDHFDLAHLGEGEGKSKFGVGHYASSVYKRADWEQISIDVMKFCLQQKYDQCLEFREELESTKGYNIVELQDRKNDKESSRANAWGVKTKGQNYEGPNIMGRLLMELRDGMLKYKLPDDWKKYW
ncbi:MAG: DUF1768 domain-containing protein [Muribaculaceae bacterium]|nr:DUF1768 domain-containing protein [Muribaculaceae bacterium]